MRWTYLRRPVKDPVDYLRTEFTVESEVLAQRVVDAARVGSTVYMAIECGDRSTGRRYTLAGIVLIADGRDGFGYKDMSECMGPYECSCPDRIMRLLSPVESLPQPGWAAEWRARVEGRLAL